jgi:hypothetical protein
MEIRLSRQNDTFTISLVNEEEVLKRETNLSFEELLHVLKEYRTLIC